MAMHPMRDYFLSGSKDEKICFWDFRTSQCEMTMNIVSVPSLAFDPTGTVFAVGFDNQHLRLYDARNYQKGPFVTWDILEKDTVLKAITGNSLAIAAGSGATSGKHRVIWLQLQFSEDGKWIFIGTGTWQYHYIIDAHTGELVESISGHGECLPTQYIKYSYGSGSAPLGNRLIRPGGFVPTVQQSSIGNPRLNRVPLVMAGDADGKMTFFEGDTARQIASFDVLAGGLSNAENNLSHLVSWLQWNPKYKVLATLNTKYLSFWQ